MSQPPEPSTSPTGSAQSLPLFYSRPEALSAARHGGLSLIVKPDFSFAASAHAVPILASEMPGAMRSYPIVFIGPGKVPVIVTGLRQGQNLFVGTDGSWVEPHYIPAYVRRYPFVLAEDGATPGRLTLCIDRGDRVVDSAMAPLHEVFGKVQPLFEGTEPTAATKQALAFANRFQIDFNATRAMVAKIDAHGLFAARQSTVTLESGEVLNLTDFQVIDEQAFNRLSDEAFLDVRKSGALALLYCHLASVNSWPSLLHQAKQRH